MSTGNITSANASYTLVIPGVFTGPVQLHGFAAEDIFSTEALETGELKMGVDGELAAGFVFNPVKQTVMLMADSDSGDIFDTWNAFEYQQTIKIPASGVISLPAINRVYNMSRGFLMGWKPIPDAKKTLQERQFGITWNRIQPAPTG